MKILTIGILFICILNDQGITQNAPPDTLPASAVMRSNSGQSSNLNKMNVTVQAGTQFWSAPGYGSGLGSFIMTGISYPVGRKFSIGGGIGVINNTLIGVHNPAAETFGNVSYTNSLVYITGQYLLNPHITVSGTVFKELNVMNNSTEYQRFRNNTPQGVYMKVNYRINDFMQIEAGFGYSRGVNPYYNSFMSPMPYNSIFSDPFFRH